MLKLTITKVWDEQFFQSFLEFKNKIHKDIPTSFIETISDYSKFFSPQSVFHGDYHWVALLVWDDSQVVAKAILNWKQGTTLGHVGFIDFVNDEQAALFLQKEVESQARAGGLTELKTPVDLNFFVKYRIRCEGGGEPFYGEPIYPSYYHDLFKKMNYSIIGRWDTYEVGKLNSILSFSKGRRKLDATRPKRPDMVKVRCVDLNEWDRDQKIIHELFLASFKDMPEFEPITFPQFKLIYDDFKYLINPKIAYIVELNGNPVGFNINYVDPQKILKSADGKKLNFLQKAILLARLKCNFSTLLIAYVGKIPGPNGEEVKGVQFKTSKLLWKYALMMNKMLVCYQSHDSPSRRSFQNTKSRPYAEYLLYGKKL